jgi:hypothetical protein
MTEDLQQPAQIREILDRRYDELKSGGIQPIDGEKVFAELRHKSERRREKNKKLRE